MNTPRTSPSTKLAPTALRLLAVVVLIGFGVLLGRGLRRGGESHTTAEPDAGSVAGDEKKGESSAIVTFEKTRQEAVGMRTAVVERGEMHETINVTGKIELNDDRVAHVNSLVDGVLREVRVRIGDDVAIDQVLAIVDSKEIGQAKLDLVKNRMSVEFAKAERDWLQ